MLETEKDLHFFYVISHQMKKISRYLHTEVKISVKSVLILVFWKHHYQRSCGVWYMKLIVYKELQAFKHICYMGYISGRNSKNKLYLLWFESLSICVLKKGSYWYTNTTSNKFFLALMLILSNAQHQTTKQFRLLSFSNPLKYVAVETILLHYPLWCYCHFDFLLSILERSATFPSLIPDSASSIAFKLLVVMNCPLWQPLLIFLLSIRKSLSFNLLSKCFYHRRHMTVKSDIFSLKDITGSPWNIYLARSPYHIRKRDLPQVKRVL